MIDDIKQQFESFIPTINTDLSLSLNSVVDFTLAYSYEELLANTPTWNAIGLSWLGSNLLNTLNNNVYDSRGHKFIIVIASNDAESILDKLIELIGDGFKINNQRYAVTLNSYAPKPANDLNKLTIYVDMAIYE